MSDGDKKSAIISLYAETHIHPGVGQSTGALDLPVSRERTTHFPFVPGSGVKGAFRVWAVERANLDEKDVDRLFGKAPGSTQGNGKEDGDKEVQTTDTGNAEYAGALLCSDARLLLLPVRSLSDAFKWVTCPALLRRFQRDCDRAGMPAALPSVGVADHCYLGLHSTDASLGLEEREFRRANGDIDVAIVAALAPIVGETELKQRLVILSDKDFVWFARYALPVMARNALDDNKIVKRGALWHEETLAPDTVMYALFGERKDGAVGTLRAAIKKTRYVQIGGNETVGQGWFKMTEYEGPASAGGGHGE